MVCKAAPIPMITHSVSNFTLHIIISVFDPRFRLLFLIGITVFRLAGTTLTSCGLLRPPRLNAIAAPNQVEVDRAS